MRYVLDKELDKRILKYVRYADDFSIYTKSKKEAGKAETRFIRFKGKNSDCLSTGMPKRGSAKLAHAVPWHPETIRI
ncbi:MAG: hypothetical protein MUE75_12760 [Algoriphagus sp.]|nr:hypothetical protein [Algoriphagus sp.]